MKDSVIYIQIKKVANRVVSTILLIPNYCYDSSRFLWFSIMGGAPRNIIQYNALITRDYHKLEKSLAFVNFKPFSGKDTIRKLLANIQLFIPQYGLTIPTKNALHTIQQYIDLHRERGHEDPYIDTIEQKLQGLNIDFNQKNWTIGGIETFKSDELIKKASIRAEDFFYSRYSIRDFSDTKVDHKKIQQAFHLARKTPSVCNRQGWKGYLIEDINLLKEILLIQGGSRGFDHSIHQLIVVAGDLNHFNGSNERNQIYADGGMFAMTLLYAFHSLGIAACTLNWSASFQKDLKLRKKLQALKGHETVIMMIAIGNYPDQITVCQSPRKEVSEILEIVA